MKATWSLSVAITVLAALAAGITPLTYGADYPSDASVNVRSNSGSNSTQCTVEELPLITGCGTVGKNPDTIPAALEQIVEMDDKQATDDTGPVLEELVKSEISYGAVKSR